MEYKKEEISIPASAAERFDQRTFPGTEIFLGSRPILMAQEREIAIEALGRKLSGSGAPAAAADLLAGIAVLDGAHRPVLVWPTDMSLEEKAAWHEKEAANFKFRAQRFEARMNALNPSAEKKSQALTGLIQMPGELAPTQTSECVNPLILIALAGRKTAFSTELFIHFDVDAENLFIELWGQDVLIGYVRVTRARAADEFMNGRWVSGFEVAELLSPRSPSPSPLVSLSAVLWSRRELPEGLAKSPFSHPLEDSQHQASPRSDEEGCPHEA